MIHFYCDNCQNVLFFENSVCLKCQSKVGFDHDHRKMVVLGPESDLALCQNGVDYHVCNWVRPVGSSQPLCAACQLNRMIPDLSADGNIVAWGKMEAAKRRVLYTLAEIGLRPKSKLQDPDGLTFDLLSPTPEAPVLTGHDNGVITLNLLEADDAHREKMRTGLGEPSRTLGGHFRHEIGHYYWDRLLKPRDTDDPVFRKWRQIFGDERHDYQAALQRYYKNGPADEWWNNYISAYATMHPWEDWAETWAQYLHILDGMETARDFGWDSQEVPIPFTPFTAAQIKVPEDEADPEFLELVNSWLRLAPALNEIALSLGQGSLFPFVFTPAAVRKIHFVHATVRAGLPKKW